MADQRDDADWTWAEVYEEGLRAGYRKGEYERVALATANSDLRSDLLRPQTALDGQR